MSEIALRVREMFTKGDRERDAGNTTPADVERFDDIVYGTDEKWQVLDVYRPKGMKGKLPVIILPVVYDEPCPKRLCGNQFHIPPGTGISVSCPT